MFFQLKLLEMENLNRKKKKVLGYKLYLCPEIYGKRNHN